MICKKHKISMIRGFNSTIYRCPKCENEKAYKKERSPTNKRKTPKSRAMANADSWFSRYIRIKYHSRIIGSEVYCRCIITGQEYNAKNMDNGHCFSRAFKSIRFNEDNCRPQNRSSNRFQGEADHYIFIKNLKKEIGEDRFETIEALRDHLGDDSEVFYKETASKYRKEVNKLLKELNINKWW
jgi:hypothetical protein